LIQALRHNSVKRMAIGTAILYKIFAFAVWQFRIPGGSNAGQ
jgi:hypothetical protein